MSWASRRRFIIVSIIIVAIVVVAGTVAYAIFHRAPTCFDNRQNQGEEGVDCGGPCAYQCTASQAAASVRFVRALAQLPGRTDAIAYVDNPNASTAAKGLHFTVELYSSTNTVLAKGEGSVDLPPASTVPIFIPGIYSGTQEVARSFITFDTPQHLWYRYQETRPIPQVEDVRIDTPDSGARVTATAVNNAAVAVRGVRFVITVFGSDGNAMAASQTVASVIPDHGSAPLIFTWPTAFAGPVSRVDIRPIIPLPPAPPTI